MCDTQERLGTSGPLDQVRAGNVTGELKAVLDAGSINGRPGEQSPVETGCSYGERSADPKGCRCQRRAVKVKTVSRVETDRPLHPTGYAALRWSGSPVHNTHPSPSGDEGIVQPPVKVGDRCPAGSTFYKHSEGHPPGWALKPAVILQRVHPAPNALRVDTKVRCAVPPKVTTERWS